MEHVRLIGSTWCIVFMSGCAVIGLAVIAACGANHSSEDPASLDVAAATKETEDWRVDHETRYRDNWATIEGLHFLEAGSHTAGSARTNDIVLPASAPAVIGRYVVQGDLVRFEPESGSRVLLGGQPVTQSITLADDGAPEPDRLEVGNIQMVVHRSGERKSLRVWDPDGEQARARAVRRRMKRRGSCTLIYETTVRRCSISTRRTTRPVPSTRIRRARFHFPRTGLA